MCCDSHALDVNGSFLFNSGTLELTGGSVTGLDQLTVPTNGTLRAVGDYSNLPVTATGGSTIVATGDLMLGDSSDPRGFYSNGDVEANDNALTLSDANDAVFDSGASVTLGDAGTGALSASGGLTLDFGGNITGFGAVDTPNDPATPMINNGNITGNSLAEPITLTGYVKGVGTCDNCNITGTDAPGFSPATVNRGSVSYNGTLEIEIGGTSAGDFDQLNHILGAGIADLGGTLDLDLINGFIPSDGDMFEIVTATDVQNMFAVENFPTLAGLDWNISYGATNVVLAVVSAGGILGDFDGDGDVDGADFLEWQRTDGTVTGLTDWQTNYGRVVPPLAASSVVPEPSSTMLLLSLLASVFACDWSKMKGPTRL